VNNKIIILSLIAIALAYFLLRPAKEIAVPTIVPSKDYSIQTNPNKTRANQISKSPAEPIASKPTISKSVNLKGISQDLTTAEPLILPYEKSETFLSIEGVLSHTNSHRREEGLNALRLDSELNKVAYAKMEDLFAKNYFAHVSPDGIGPKELIEQFDYPFLLIGENLAKGNFQTDKRLVQAWMDSPGHRENIMKPSFQEIGIAVGQTLDNGRSVWISVQSFGTPASSCPSPTQSDELLEEKNYLDDESLALEELRIEIAGTNNRSWIEDYNYRAEQFNQRKDDFNREVERHNQQVEQARLCIEELGS